MKRCAVVGGGPGGLLAAYFLNEKIGPECQVTLFEADARLGGKIKSDVFSSAPVLYEAGVAELYDYSRIGPDPLKELVAKFGLATVPMQGPAVVLNGRILRSSRDIQRLCGEDTHAALAKYERLCSKLVSPEEYYEGHWQDDNDNVLASQSFSEFLQKVPNPTARRYLRTAVHSDLATEPHLTNALNGVKNSLMDDPRYMKLYSIRGGIEQFSRRLAASVVADLNTCQRVTRVEQTSDGRYQLFTRGNGTVSEQTFDLLILALPDYWLRSIEFGDDRLSEAIERHCIYYDRPAHYLRVSILFREPFWRDQIPGSYFMLDAFGGCCVYDEGSRYDTAEYGVLGWLLAGNDALVYSNYDDQTLTAAVLDSLPPTLQRGKELVIESKVHRWLSSVNGLPGGYPAKDMFSRHVPEPKYHPNLFLVGDYMFDSTINGVLDSADFATDLILTKLRRAEVTSPATVSSQLDGEYFSYYDGERTYEESFLEYFDAEYTADLIDAAWGARPPYKLLDAGSASGLTLAEFEKIGIKAWGVENNSTIYAQTPHRWRKRNLFGDIRQLEFGDDAFDFVYDTALCYVPEQDLEHAIRELYRVTKRGLIFGSVAVDMSAEIIEKHDIFYGVRSLKTLWEWSELFLSCGFRFAVTDQARLEKIWQIEVEANEGDAPWYPNMDAMRCCFYSKPAAQRGKPLPSLTVAGRETAKGSRRKRP